MSHPIRSTALRTLAAAGLLGGLSLLAPATTHAQVISPERGLLNYTATAVTPGLPSYAGWGFGLSHAVAVGSLEGARALLGAQASGNEPSPRPTAAASKPPVDGDRALRNAFPRE